MSPLRRPARRHLRAAAVLSAAGLALTACGSVTPGAAATVDGTTISMSTLDDTARVYCEVTARSAQQQGVAAIDNADIRRQAATDLVLERVARDVAEERDVKVPPPTDLPAEQFEEAFGSRAPEVADAISGSQDLFNLYAAIAADDAGTPVTAATSEQLAQAGRALVLAELPDHDVTFSPRLGLSASGAATGEIGSLSVTPPEAEATSPENLLPAARCTA